MVWVEARRYIYVSLMLLYAAFPAAKEVVAEYEEAPPVVITATRKEKPLLDLPTSASTVERDDIQKAYPNLQPADALSRVSGVFAQDRGRNFTQDAKITIRGFGARTAFGVREIKLFWDGIPLTTADGQGDIDRLDMSFIKRVEVLKGPLAVLYGNTAGAVIYFETEDGPMVPFSSELKISGGSYGLHKENIKIGGQLDKINYMLGLTSLYTTGFREHQSARRHYANLKTTLSVTDKSLLTLTFHLFDEPFAKDPGALTKAEFEQNPRQASPINKQRNAREIIDNRELGLLYQHELSPNNSFKIFGYMGNRDFIGYISTAVNNFGRNYYGAGFNWFNRFAMFGRNVETTLGLDAEFTKERRIQFENVNGSKGRLQFTQNTDVENMGLYAIISAELLKNLQLIGGARYSEVDFSAEYYRVLPSAFPSPLSSDRSFQSTSWALTLGYKVLPTTNLYLGVGRGFMTPAIIELINSPNQIGGLNPNLKEAKFYNYEAGLKTYLGQKTYLDTSVFLVKTRDEFIPRQISPNVFYYVNAGKTERKGLELSLTHELPFNLYTVLSYTYLDAKFQDFIDVDNINKSGKRIPGLPRNALFYELGWKPSKDALAALELKYVDKVWADNSNTASADSYAIVNLRGSYKFHISRYGVEAFFRVENIFDEKYVISVVPNATAGRYYEPGPGRNYYVGMALSF
ncbi:MAG: TonB-dependent receptor [Candidatus Bathyarchaeia archaeon]